VHPIVQEEQGEEGAGRGEEEEEGEGKEYEVTNQNGRDAHNCFSSSPDG